MYEIRQYLTAKAKVYYRIYREDGKFMQTYTTERDAKNWIETYGEKHANRKPTNN